MQIGAQFYTLREHCKTLDTFADALKRVADIGYRTVQISGTCAYEPQWLAEKLRENGLECVLTHIPAARLLSEPEKVAQDHDIFDCEHVGLGYYSFKGDGSDSTFDYFFEHFSVTAQALHKAGKYFMYHNHDNEFQKWEGKLILEHILERIPAEHLGVTLDTFWVQAAGGDPAYWLDRCSGRAPCIHLKDFAYGGKMAVVGEGNINFDRVFAAAEAAGTRYMLVEQDDCNGEDPFDCLARSYAFLKANGFE